MLDNHITFIEQFKTKKCININMLPFDFKIYYNQKDYFLLEFQGQQHYEIIDFSSKKPLYLLEDDFLKIQNRDAIKRSFCKENNIELLEIPYWDYNNIEKILKEKLNIVD